MLRAYEEEYRGTYYLGRNLSAEAGEKISRRVGGFTEVDSIGGWYDPAAGEYVRDDVAAVVIVISDFDGLLAVRDIIMDDMRSQGEKSFLYELTPTESALVML